jgi:hypothetical protein
MIPSLERLAFAVQGIITSLEKDLHDDDDDDDDDDDGWEIVTMTLD